MSVETFKKYLNDNQIKIEITTHNQTARTSQDAAKANGVGIEDIVKSLLVKEKDEFVLYLVPGNKKLNLYSEMRMATADEVKEITGYSIGGVPPFGHIHKLRTVLIEGFIDTHTLIAAAGAHDATFKTTLQELCTMCGVPYSSFTK
jgi:prolyl-tRNA editing enzyme YbaK/EbsC (Cys-tRNA(Pro) deacylase)